MFSLEVVRTVHLFCLEPFLVAVTSQQFIDSHFRYFWILLYFGVHLKLLNTRPKSDYNYLQAFDITSELNLNSFVTQQFLNRLFAFIYSVGFGLLQSLQILIAQ